MSSSSSSEDAVDSCAPVPTGKTYVTSYDVKRGDVTCGDVADDDDDVRCGAQIGCGPCASRRFTCGFLQRFATAKWAVLFIGSLAFLQGFTINGHTNAVLSTIEKRFELSSTSTGLLASSYDIAACLAVLAVTYRGGRGHKPQWLGWGACLVALGSLLCALPHFVTPAPPHPTRSTGNTCASGDVTAGDDDVACGSSVGAYRFLFYLSFCLIGVGATPLYSLGVTYLDENVKQRYSSMYTGCLFSLGIAGPGVGFLVGSTLLKIPADFNERSPESGEEEEGEGWIGAWWLGYIISGLASLLVTLPILLLPRELPRGREYRSKRARELYDDSLAVELEHDRDFGKTVKDVPRSILLLLRNPTFVLLTFASAMDALVINGFTTFGPKFVQFIYGMRASDAGLYFGGIAIAGGVLGVVSGGAFVSRFDMSTRRMLHISYVSPIVGALAAVCFYLSCADGAADLVGVGSESSCSSECGCSESLYEPVCGSDNRTYFSPCYAGCTVAEAAGSFSNCSCVLGVERSAIPGACGGGGCSKGTLMLFLSLLFLLIFSTFFNHTPSLQVSMRSVVFSQRSNAVGFQWFTIRLLGTIPGPLIMGSVFDAACKIWSSSSDECGVDDGEGGRGSCAVYDSRKLTLYSFLFCLFAKIVGSAFSLVAMLVYKPVVGSMTSSSTTTSSSSRSFSSASAKPHHIPSASSLTSSDRRRSAYVIACGRSNEALDDDDVTI